MRELHYSYRWLAHKMHWLKYSTMAYIQLTLQQGPADEALAPSESRVRKLLGDGN